MLINILSGKNGWKWCERARARKRIECKCLNGENGNDKVARLLCYCKLVIAFNFSMFIFPAVFLCVCVYAFSSYIFGWKRRRAPAP